jgi:uroporphyrinogen-III decarboxylase
LEQRAGSLVVQDWMGSIVQISDQYDYTYLRRAKDFVTRKWLDAPVHDRSDWQQKMKWRYDPHHPDRFPADFEERCRRLKTRKTVLRLDVNGPFWQLREWCGFEGLCMLMIDDPDFVEEMIEFWSDFILQTLEPILSRITPDYVMVAEDMAYKAHSMISPAMVRRFLMPVWATWIDVLNRAGCELVAMDSDGYIAELMPLWIETGFNMTFPVEVAAGNDIVAYRRTYGDRMAYLGGIDKRALAAGGDIMRAEVMRVVPPLLEDGGYVPGCDHGVPPDISWPNFVEYTRLLAQLTGWLP